jgi:phosphonate metabolism protein PhnN/1,5-bisphosphokinase (PRPP-forming)
MTSAIGQVANDDALRLGPGAIVLVVGPSGAGKDTLLRLAKVHFADTDAVMFPRRLITRGPDVNEDHECIDEKTLRNKVASGDVALAWTAHGLDYAVPSTIDEAIAGGSVVVVNVSRTIIPQAMMKYTRVVVAFVTAPADVLAERLQQRGRESPDDVAGRLDRAASDELPSGPEVAVIQNVGHPALVVQKLINLIDSLATVEHP